MGIKGIYKEIGPGDRVSLCKLAVEKLKQTGRPLRVAIDISIWQFQTQAAKGGSNPAIRTLFYRLLRLMGLAIQPIFVFDGPRKPAFKRNKRSVGRSGTSIASAMAKQVIRLFGFAIHDAPGEAEAECALLQQQGVVDAVLSEDVDTIMFGCRRTLRNWTSEGPKGSKTPTHVSVYDADEVASGTSGLNREGMVLVALMSGGDYLPEGVPGCGVKVACEAARAGFGRDLCQIKRADTAALAAWKSKLLHELCTNESKFFRTKHKALEIPDEFPNMEILGYYTHPVVSRQDTVDRLKRGSPSTKEVDVIGLRKFVGETFDWNYRNGAVKLIRVLAPSLLVQILLDKYRLQEPRADDLDQQKRDEAAIVKAVSIRRTHFSTDATPELRISFIPADIVGLNLDAEPEEEVEGYGRSGIALNSDDEFDDDAVESPESAGTKKTFDSLQLDLAWIPESIVKIGVPLTVEDWEEKLHSKERRASAKAAARTTRTRSTRSKKTDMPTGALDKFVKVTKSTSTITAPSKVSTTVSSSGSSFSAIPPSSQGTGRQPLARSATIGSSTRQALGSGGRRQPRKPSKPQPSKPTAGINPWTLAGSQESPRVTKSITYSTAHPKPNAAQHSIYISSSPAAPSPLPRRDEAVTSAEVAGQMTPRKREQTQSPPPDPPFQTDPPSPSPIPRKLRSVVARSRTTVVASANLVDDTPASDSASSQTTRKPRPFKQPKSREDSASTVLTQKSITDYGKLSKGSGSGSTNAKASPTAGFISRIEIDLLSGDESDGNFPPLQQLRNARFHRTFRPPTADGRDKNDIKDDNEDELPPQNRRTVPPYSTALDPGKTGSHSLSVGEIESGDGKENRQSSADNFETRLASLAKETTAAATTSSATTKLYFLRSTTDADAGYLEEVEVSREVADGVMAATSTHNKNSDSSGDNDDSQFGIEQDREIDKNVEMLVKNHCLRDGNSRVWRGSDVAFVDLTG
ncbi:hypothetical protein B0T26DRAFT_674815 [Lasiosphaeria miniovina]|uniref:Flap structure-specific endonuclease n=1 Tax=Lasiosphaeria miniovina TaxID=1954250 RepID=A0AA40E3Z9_9PEZI|nr:uncharacterized protein B0T26DRAFT_674815 [Lasiosphaeria miniovina]KAK0723216.1 hypothetical protein B0T26DRAFT_674815 [Lasiosphaeria miniovina]